MVFCLHFLVDRTTLPHGYYSIMLIGNICERFVLNFKQIHNFFFLGFTLNLSNSPHIYRLRYFDNYKLNGLSETCHYLFALHFSVLMLSPCEQRKIDPDFPDDQTSLAAIFQVLVVVGGKTITN